MALPVVAADVRTFLEGYGITQSIMSDAAINEFIGSEVAPYIEKYTRVPITGVKTVTEYYSGNGTGTLFLNRRNLVKLISAQMLSGEDVTAIIDINSIEPIPNEGILKIKSALSEYFLWRVFPKGTKNLKITYTCGFDESNIPADLIYTIKLLASISVLDMIEGRTGGGNLSTQGWSRDYGSMGKYTNIRKRMAAKARYFLRTYSTGIVGS